MEKVITTETLVKDYDFETGNKIINDYIILREIGRGVHGKVKLAKNKYNGQLVAIKIVDRTNRKQKSYSLLRKQHQQQLVSNESKINKEISILKKCCHPNVVKLYEVIDAPDSTKIYLVLEYTEKGEIEWRDDLDQPVLSIEQSRKIFRDIVNGLDYLHALDIIHRDIKPANLLISQDGVAKISDFGVSTTIDDKELSETAGTPAFFAPELCCTDAHKRPRITKSIDVWALGVTLYCFIFGQCPFTAATEFELFDVIPTQPLSFPYQIDNNLKDLLQKLLTKNPDERITLDQVKRHPWVTEDIDDVDEWLTKSDPHYYIQEESYFNMFSRIKQSIKRLSSFYFNSRKQPPSSPPKESPTTTTKEPEYVIHSGLPSPPLRPILADDTSSYEAPTPKRPSLDRRVSSSSSISGMGLTFGRFRGGFTPMNNNNN